MHTIIVSHEHGGTGDGFQLNTQINLRHDSPARIDGTRLKINVVFFIHAINFRQWHKKITGGSDQDWVEMLEYLTVDGSFTGYLFKCRHCEEMGGYWDCR